MGPRARRPYSVPVPGVRYGRCTESQFSPACSGASKLLPYAGTPCPRVWAVAVARTLQPAIFPSCPPSTPPTSPSPALAVRARCAVRRRAPADGVLPEGFFSTTNLPTYVRIGGAWRLPREPRMDSALVLDAGRRALGARGAARARRATGSPSVQAEDGREGIYVHAGAFMEEVGSDGEFKFMVSEVSREKPIDYALMAKHPRRRARRRRLSRSGSPVRRSCTRARATTWSGSSSMASSARCSPATRSRCTTSRRRSSARRSA